jgi:hypothetical protein
MVDDLDDNLRDRLVALTRGAAALVPFAGSFLGELLVLIPGQRVDRIVLFIRHLEERLAGIEDEQRQKILSRPDKIDFVEEGGRQAARAISADRISKIAEAVAKGLTSDEADAVRRKRLLLLLGQIDDDELQLLDAYGQSFGLGTGSRAQEIWDRVNMPPRTNLRSNVEEIDQQNLFDAGRANLLRLGLLRKSYPFVKRGEMPEFDASKGDFRHTVALSYLGRMLLREIGMPSLADRDKEAAERQE